MPTPGSSPSDRVLRWAVASMAVIVLALGIAIAWKYSEIVNRPIGPPRRPSRPVADARDAAVDVVALVDPPPSRLDAGPRPELDAGPALLAVADAGSAEAPPEPADAGVAVAVAPAADGGVAAEPTSTFVKGRGKLTLRTKPKVTVYLRGRRIGDTPMLNLSVPAGHLVLRLVRADTKEERLLEVDITPGRTTTRRLDF